MSSSSSTKRRVMRDAAAIAGFLIVGITAVGAQEAPAWQALLERIVNINSGTQNTEGLEAVRQVLIPEFEALGLEATLHDLDDDRRLLSMAVPDAKPQLLLMGHIDTVFPADSPFQTAARDGGRIVGPGVIDMKAGVVMIRDVLAELEPAERAGVLVILNDDEEIGSPWSGALVRELVSGIGTGLIFEPGLPGGAVVTSHSGVVWLTLAVDGRAAHAGLEPERGINACVELADKVVRLSRLSDYSRNLSVNVGVIDGGTKPNVVCEHAEARIDVRFVEPEDRERTLAAIREIADDMVVHNDLLGAGPMATLETVVDIPSMPPAFSERPFGLLQAAGERSGHTVSGTHVGYASDANQLTVTGMDLLVGLGPYGGNIHTDEEFLEIASYGERLRLNVALVREILD